MRIACIDEVGRGPLAGPVIAAAVILSEPIAEAKDSKRLAAAKREYLVPHIQTAALAYAYGRAEVEEIDSLNIHKATLLAMKRAIEKLTVEPEEVWVDGKFAPAVSMPCKTFIKGDATVNAIACASILAKVARDAEMQALDALYPGYGFAQHKGYGTRSHLEAIERLGPCPIHRLSFAPLKHQILVK